MKTIALLTLLPLLAMPGRTQKPTTATRPAQESAKKTAGMRGRPRVLLPIPSYPVQRREDSIAIDGSLLEWPRRMPGLLLNHPGQLSGTAHGSWHGKADLSAGGMLLWDEKFLYLAFQIADDWPRSTPRKIFPVGGQLPPGDSVSLFFDPRRDSRSHGPDQGRKEDKEYWIGTTSKGRSLILPRNRLEPEIKIGTKAGAVMVYDQKHRSYTIESAIPWKEILPADMAPREGLAIDFQVIVQDFDSPLDMLPQTRIGWTFGSAPRIHPMIWGTLVLCGQKWKGDKPPTIPPLPVTQNKLPDHGYWFDLIKNLGTTRPAAGREGLSGKRGELLRVLQDHMRAYPRLDYEQLLVLGQRRMRREYDGYLADNLPFFLAERMKSIGDRLEKNKPPKTPSIIKLPGRGWLIWSKDASIALSPAGPLLQEGWLAQGLDAVFYARALDPLDRNDPLAFRMMALQKPVLTHIAFQFPGLIKSMKEEDLAKIGSKQEIGEGVELRVLGRTGKKGQVSTSAGIQLTWPTGFTIVYPSLAGMPDQVQLAKGKHIDVLILDPDNPETARFVELAKGGRILLDGFLDADRFPKGSLVKTHWLEDYDKFLEAYSALEPSVWLLAPGEFLDF